jgi:hypothetical protein
MTDHHKTEVKQHPAGGFTLAVPASTHPGSSFRYYAGHFETEEAAVFALGPVRRPRWRQLALRLIRQCKSNRTANP